MQPISRPSFLRKIFWKLFLRHEGPQKSSKISALQYELMVTECNNSNSSSWSNSITRHHTMAMAIEIQIVTQCNRLRERESNSEREREKLSNLRDKRKQRTKPTNKSSRPKKPKKKEKQNNLKIYKKSLIFNTCHELQQDLYLNLKLSSTTFWMLLSTDICQLAPLKIPTSCVIWSVFNSHG